MVLFWLQWLRPTPAEMALFPTGPNKCAVVAIIGGVLGAICVLPAAGWIPQFTMAPPVWLFALAMTVAAAVLFSIPAGWRLLRAPLVSGSCVTHSRIGDSLIAAQVAMALLVLTGATLLTRSFSAILNENPGFRAQRVWVIPNVPLRRSFETAPAFLSNQLLPQSAQSPA